MHLTSDEECKGSKKCETYKIESPKKNPKKGVSDMVIVHKERYMRPVRDEANNFLRFTITNILGRKFYCPKKACLLKRHPYFWKGLIKIEELVQEKMESIHLKALFQPLVTQKQHIKN